MEKILVAGGTGLLGSSLIQKLLQKGYRVAVLSRDPQPLADVEVYEWDIGKGYIDQDAWEDVWATVNLAGAGIVDKPWTEKRKAILHKSRIDGNELLVKTMEGLEKPPRAFLAASAIGFYGDRPNQLLDESSPAGSDSFLVRLCQLWEDSADTTEMEIKASIIRIGLVLSDQGGIVPRLRQTMPLGIGSYFGNGKQGASWIHIDDLTDIMIRILEQGSEGIYNGVAPHPVTFRKLVKELARQKGLGILLPVPKFMLRLIMGERSNAILQDASVLPKRILSDGYTYQYSDLDKAIASLAC